MKRRPVNAFSLAFLDIMFCGFGAVVLLVLILNANTQKQRNEVVADRRSEVVRLESEVIVGEENRVQARNSLVATEKEIVRMQGEASRVLTSMLEIEAGLTDLNKQTLARRQHINQLKSDIKGLDKSTQSLSKQQQARPEKGKKIHRFVGEGNRQYLTGLKLSGKRTLILLDASASMLDETIVNIIRLRNMSTANKRAAVKWKRAQGTAEWLLSNLPSTTRFQLYLFNTTATSSAAGTAGKWLNAGKPAEVAAAVNGLRAAVPAGGTSLMNAFEAAAALSPQPDNILLITDGLPTQGRTKPAASTVSGQQRLTLFSQAVKKLPAGVPVNTILLPMEGDAAAAAAFWQLAIVTQGSFMTPARDWP